MTAKQLRASILQLAVQGKLVPQDPADEPASKLLARIRAEKARLVKEGKLKKEKNSSEIFVGSDGATYEKFAGGTTKDISDEIPFDLPKGWAWARLFSIFSLQAGKTISSDRIFPAPSKGMVPCYGGNGIRGYVEEINHEGLYPIIGRQGALCGNINKVSGQFYATEHAVCVETYAQTNVDWCCVFLEALDLHQYATATAQPGLSVAKVSQALIPVPPLAEQKRIVFKIDELIPLLNEYDEAQAAAIIHESSFPDDFRKSVLQAAVQGKLVSQSLADEPAEIMLDRLLAKAEVSATKRARGKAIQSRIFRDSDKRTYETRSGETVCIDDELPFDIPDSWTWTRLEAICSFIHRGKSPVYSPIRQYPVVAQKCNQWSGFSLAKAQFIDPDSISRYSDQDLLQDGDLLWNSTGLGTLGRMAIYDSKANPFGFAVADSHVTVIRPLNEVVSPPYLYYYFANPSVQNVIEDLADGTTKQKELATSTVRNYLIPLPPLAEQGRIVTEIGRLLALGERLRATL